MRLLFTLGNLTAKLDEARQQLFQCEGCMPTLLQLYDTYQRRDNLPHSLPQRGAAASLSTAREDEDVLVKLLRVLANMCIHPAVGPAVAANTNCIELLMETLGEQHQDNSSRSISGSGKQHMTCLISRSENLAFF